MKTIELSMTTSYADYWSVPNAIRELYANALDGVKGDASQVNVHYDEDSRMLYISNPAEATMKVSALVLGASEKSDDEIGRFGEGMKLAYAVLLREGRKVTTRNCTEIWTPTVRNSEQFSGEVVCVDITTQANYDKWGNVVEHCIECEPWEVREFMEECVHFHEYCFGAKPREIKVEEGAILIGGHVTGNIYVGGMRVGRIPSRVYGINIKPAFAKLGRDRSSIDGDTEELVYRMVGKAMVNDTGLFTEIASNDEDANTIASYLHEDESKDLNDMVKSLKKMQGVRMANEFAEAVANGEMLYWKRSGGMAPYGGKNKDNLCDKVFGVPDNVLETFVENLNEELKHKELYEQRPEFGMKATDAYDFINGLNVTQEEKETRIRAYLTSCYNTAIYQKQSPYQKEKTGTKYIPDL